MEPPHGPTLTEAELRDAGAQQAADMLRTAMRAAEVAAKADRIGPGMANTTRDARKGALGVALGCAQRAVLVLEIALEAKAPERTD